MEGCLHRKLHRSWIAFAYQMTRVAPMIYDLSHTRDPKEKRRFVNYRDMSVQQLGSIYERLLEREPVRDEGEQHQSFDRILTPERTVGAFTPHRNSLI